MIDFNNLSRVHDPQKIEKSIYDWWESEGYFRPEKQRELGLVEENGPRFCITLPPPNVTGVLHLGHAIVISPPELEFYFFKVGELLTKGQVSYAEESAIGKKYGQVFLDDTKHWK